ncbi:O-antigen ligase family protein [Georgenia sp. M64]|uniref:O-antigen ligase family protein n=1 Tax=Georgenia sp. M64 TaxID=3120520 RepID=UPI0030E260ED
MLALAYIGAIPFAIYPSALGRSLVAIFSAPFMIVWTLEKLRSQELVRVRPFPMALIGLFCGWAALTGFWASTEAPVLSAVLSLMWSAATTVAIADVLSRLWLSALVSLSAGAMLLSTIVLISPQTISGRANLGGIDENLTSFVLSVGAGAGLFLFQAVKSRLGRWIAGAGLLLIGLAVLYTGSRTGVVATGLMAVATALFAVSSGSGRGIRAALALFAALTLIGSLASSYDLMPRRIQQFLGGEADGINDSGRGEISDLFLRTVDRWFIAGVGYSSDAHYLAGTEGIYRNAHGIFWKTWVELGIIGVLILSAIVGAAVISSFQLPSRRAVWLMMITLTCFGLTLGGLSVDAFWLVVSFAIACPSGHSASVYASDRTNFPSTSRRHFGSTREQMPSDSCL